MFAIPPLCAWCKHLRSGTSCDAYPGGIPVPILSGDIQHTEPYLDDHGVRFEPVPGAPYTGSVHFQGPQVILESGSADTANKLFGQDKWTPDELGQLGGVLEDSSCRIRSTGDSLTLDVRGPTWQASRTVTRDGDNLVLQNDNFSTREQGRHLGTAMLSRQIDAARKLGVSRIAANSSNHQHLPLLGFDGPIPEATKQKLPTSLSGAKNISDLLLADGGISAWQQYGQPGRLTLSLAPGSLGTRFWDAFRNPALGSGNPVPFATAVDQLWLDQAEEERARSIWMDRRSIWSEKSEYPSSPVIPPTQSGATNGDFPVALPGEPIGGENSNHWRDPQDWLDYLANTHLLFTGGLIDYEAWKETVHFCLQSGMGQHDHPRFSTACRTLLSAGEIDPGYGCHWANALAAVVQAAQEDLVIFSSYCHQPSVGPEDTETLSRSRALFSREPDCTLFASYAGWVENFLRDNPVPEEIVLPEPEFSQAAFAFPKPPTPVGKPFHRPRPGSFRHFGPVKSPGATVRSGRLISQVRGLAKKKQLRKGAVKSITKAVSKMTPGEASHVYAGLVKGDWQPGNPMEAADAIGRSLLKNPFLDDSENEDHSFAHKIDSYKEGDARLAGIIRLTRDGSADRNAFLGLERTAFQQITDMLNTPPKAFSPPPEPTRQIALMRDALQRTLADSRESMRKMEAARAKLREAFRGMMKPKFPVQIEMDTSKASTETQRAAELARKFVRDIFSLAPGQTGSLSVKILDLDDGTTRGWYQQVKGGGEIRVNKNARPVEILHLLGHALEDSLPGLRDLCQQFIKLRFQEDPIDMETVPGGASMVGEKGRMGGFDTCFRPPADAYVGKVNQGKQTEVIPMILQGFWEDPANMARDPVFFKFAVGLLAGDLS